MTRRVALEIDGTVVLGEQQFRGRQGRLLFAYLVCERARPVPKGELAELLWPGEIPPAWEISLSALLSRIRRNLDHSLLDGHEVSLSSGFGQHRLILPADVWVDLEAATSGIDRAESYLRAGDYSRILGPATVAASISRRSFLSDVGGLERCRSAPGSFESPLVLRAARGPTSPMMLRSSRLSTGRSSPRTGKGLTTNGVTAAQI